MLTTFVNALLPADAVCGAGYGVRTAEPMNRRNGYRHRDFAPPHAGGTPTRAGAVPELQREDGAGRPGFLRDLVARALTGVLLLGRESRRPRAGRAARPDRRDFVHARTRLRLAGRCQTPSSPSGW